MNEGIEGLFKEILVDAIGEDEQLTAFAQAFERSARFPFPARVLGVPVHVTGIVYSGQERRGLVALCRRDDEEHSVSLLDVVPGPVAVQTSMLVEAYRRWCGLAATGELPAPPVTRVWAYRHLAATRVVLSTPLGLRAVGLWDPADQYWGEPGEDLHPLVLDIVAAGPRPEFEMEQVIPGVGDDDWDLDPVADAAELHRAGADREASRILDGLIVLDERCVDAWVHLGNIAFDNKGPKAAGELYERAVAIAEQSLPTGFVGVLSWGLIDNRPFLRALHGLGLCAWRQRRWDDAEEVFISRVWLEGAGTSGALSCLERVRARQRWTQT